ncbi:hypothetical protein L1987_24517 [Smallanthus sonchifolius]|uniref:Uncharacterized protein n=1 Tax=Smallanthus sonchifolius TaxID=185202 RepID=A0ACB9IM03_9ASTR|nr:hypothetical protein L1987_24517 [Smallanthus sonchifolius]
MKLVFPLLRKPVLLKILTLENVVLFLFLTKWSKMQNAMDQRLIDLVIIGGVIGYDNTLWNGFLVASSDAPLRKYVRYYRDFVQELNKALAIDPRVEICQLPVGDGITVCRRIS